MSRPIVSGTLLVLLALSARPALAGTYTYVDLGVSGQLATGTGINTAGQVVGSVFDTAARTYRAFVWQAGQLTMVQGPKASYILNFEAINDAGLVVGSYSNNHTPPTFYETAVIYDIKTGQFTFPAQSFAQSSLAAVSAGGEAVGVVNQEAAGVPSALVVKNGVATTVTPSPDALNPFFDGITGGVAYGGYATRGPGGRPINHYFLYQNGQTTLVPDPSGFGIYGAYSVTGSGRLVGGAHRLGHGAELGFVYDPNDGAISLVRYPGAVGTVLLARTPSGILGAYYYQLHSTAQRFFVRFGTKDYTLTLPFAASFTIGGWDSNLDFTGGYTDAGGTTHAFAAICTADQAPCTQ